MTQVIQFALENVPGTVRQKWHTEMLVHRAGDVDQGGVRERRGWEGCGGR